MGAGKRILATGVLVVSALGILICAAAIAVVWVFNSSLIRTGVKRLEKLEALVAAGQNGLGKVDEAVIHVESAVNRVNEEIAKNKEAFIQKEVVMSLMEIVTDETATEKIENAKIAYEDLQNKVHSVHSFLEAVAVSRDGASPAFLNQKLTEIDTLLSKILSGMTELEQLATDMKTWIIQPTNSALTVKTQDVRQVLQKIRIPLDTVKNRAEKAAVNLSRIKSRLSWYLRSTGVGVTLILTWLIFAQGCLFCHSYRCRAQ